MSNFVEIAQRTELFAGIDRAELETLSWTTQVVEAREGQTIFREGEPADRLFLVEEGSVRIAKGQGAMPGQYKRFLATLVPGDIFGEMALVLEEPRSAAALAASQVRLHSLSRTAFDNLVARRDALAFQVLRNLAAMMCRRLARTCDGLVGLHQKVAPETTAALERVESGLFNRAG